MVDSWAQLAKYVDEGGWVNYVILAVLAMSISVMVERIWYFYLRCRLNSTSLLNNVMALLRKQRITEARKLCTNTKTPLGAILEAGLLKFEQAGGPGDIKDSMDEASLREIPKLQKRTHYLSLFANVSTLFGLLGTIFGLQEAFMALDAADPSQKSKLLAKGIAMAMNTTALGLMGAIPSMIAFSYLGAKANSLLEQIDEAMARLLNFLSTQSSGTPGSGASPN